MRFLFDVKRELSRIFSMKFTKIIAVLIAAALIMGQNIRKDYYNTNSSLIILGPCYTATVAGSILFSLFIVLEYDKMNKNNINEIMNSIVSPLYLNFVKVAAMELTVIIFSAASSVLYYPYAVYKLHILFDIDEYINTFYLFMMCSIMLSVLCSSAFYMIFNRADLSLISAILLAIITSDKLFDGFNILHWFLPSIPDLSDHFGGCGIFYLMTTNRIFWFAFMCALWCLGVLCVRNYGIRITGSFVANCKNRVIPFMAVFLILCAGFTVIRQTYVPLFYKDGYIDNILKDYNKQLKIEDINVDASINDKAQAICGRVNYTVENKKHIKACQIRKNEGYKFKRIFVNNKQIDLSHYKYKLDLIEIPLPKSDKAEISIEYSGIPKIVDMSLGDYDFLSIISSKYTEINPSNLYPFINNTNSSKISIKLSMNSNLVPIPYFIKNNNEKDIKESVTKISNKDNKSVYLIKATDNHIFLNIGEYVKKKIGTNNMPIEFYYNKKIEESNVSTYEIENMLKYTAAYAQKKYGKLDHVSSEAPLRIVETPMYKYGGLGVSNYSTFLENDFYEGSLETSDNKSESKEVLVHEVLHQWWGLTSMTSMDGDAEGFVQYCLYRIMKEKYGENYADKHFVSEWKEEVRNENMNFYNRNPKYLKILPEEFADDIKDNNNTVKWYNKRPLQMLKAEKLIGGEEKMDKILYELHEQSKKKKVSWNDFLKKCNLKEEDLKID